MTEQQRRARIHRLVLAGADVTRRHRRPIDGELHTLLDTRPRKTPATRPGPVQFRSYLDTRGVRRWTDASGREVRFADLPAAIRSADGRRPEPIQVAAFHR